MSKINLLMKGGFPAFKRMLFGRNLLPHLAVAMLIIMLATSCQEDEVNEPGGTSNLKVEVELTYSLGESLGDIAYVEIMYPTTSNFEEGVATDTLRCGETWTKTLTYDAPATVGMIVSALHKEGAVPEGVITTQYEYSCNVRLMDGDKVVDTKVYSDTQESTLNYETDSHFHEQLAAALDFHTLFSVDNKSIKVTDREIKDSDLIGAEKLPEEDNNDVTMTNTLYYISSADVTTNLQCLHDNILARFSNKQQYTAGQKLSKGDFLFLKGSEINSADKEALRESAVNGAIFILDKIDSYQTLEDFCNTIGAHNFMSESTDISEELFIIADAAVSLADNEASPYSGFFYILSPKDDNGNYVDDYTQGQVIDNALFSIQRVLNNFATNRLAAVTRADDDLQNVKDLVGAIKFYTNKTVTIDKSQYRNMEKANVTEKGTSNTYGFEHDIWHVYSIDEDRNYYLIHQEIICSFADAYRGVYNANVTTNGCHTIAKVSEWYGKNIKVTLTPVNALSMQIHRSSPETMQSSTSYTSGFAWNLARSVAISLDGGASSTVSGGVTFSTSSTYKIDDVVISNLCSQNSKLSWNYDIRGASAHFNLFSTACTVMDESALCGRTTFTAGTDCIISLPATTEAPELKFEAAVTLRSSCGKAGCICGERDNVDVYNSILKLPFLQKSDLKDGNN